jgi:hypothetical protein
MSNLHWKKVIKIKRTEFKIFPFNFNWNSILVETEINEVPLKINGLLSLNFKSGSMLYQVSYSVYSWCTFKEQLTVLMSLWTVLFEILTTKSSVLASVYPGGFSWTVEKKYLVDPDFWMTSFLQFFIVKYIFFCSRFLQWPFFVPFCWKNEL